MSEQVEHVVTEYVHAWITSSSDERKALLDRAWADDGVYSDPMNYADGRGELLNLIG